MARRFALGNILDGAIRPIAAPAPTALHSDHSGERATAGRRVVLVQGVHRGAYDLKRSPRHLGPLTNDPFRRIMR